QGDGQQDQGGLLPQVQQFGLAVLRRRTQQGEVNIRSRQPDSCPDRKAQPGQYQQGVGKAGLAAGPAEEQVGRRNDKPEPQQHQPGQEGPIPVPDQVPAAVAEPLGDGIHVEATPQQGQQGTEGQQSAEEDQVVQDQPGQVPAQVQKRPVEEAAAADELDD